MDAKPPVMTAERRPSSLGSRKGFALTLSVETEAVEDTKVAAPEYIEAEALAALLGGDSAQRKKLVLMDVRQADYAGDNIAGALHIPFGEFDQSVADLAQEHGRGKTVVVNCMYSQQRGPSAAASLLRRIRSDCDHPGEESEVLVLRGGFHRWLNRWINDDEEAEALIEAYDPRMWKHENERMQLVHVADHPDTALELAIQRLSGSATPTTTYAAATTA